MTSVTGAPVSIGDREPKLFLPQSTLHVIFTVTIMLLIL